MVFCRDRRPDCPSIVVFRCLRTTLFMYFWPAPKVPKTLPPSFGFLLRRVLGIPHKNTSVSRCLTHGRIYGNFKLHLISKASCEYIFFLLTFSFYQRKSKFFSEELSAYLRRRLSDMRAINSEFVGLPRVLWTV